MVCEETVLIVTTGVGPVVLAFLSRYTRPVQEVASGNVMEAAEVPVKTSE